MNCSQYGEGRLHDTSFSHNAPVSAGRGASAGRPSQLLLAQANVTAECGFVGSYMKILIYVVVVDQQR
jgi:hypothetical protein